MEDDSSQQSSARPSTDKKQPPYLKGVEPEKNKRNQDLKPDVNVIQIDQAHLSLAKKLIDGDSLQSP